MKTKYSRREFIKISGMGLGSLATAGGVFGFFSKSTPTNNAASSAEILKTPTAPR